MPIFSFNSRIDGFPIARHIRFEVSTDGDHFVKLEMQNSQLTATSENGEVITKALPQHAQTRNSVAFLDRPVWGMATYGENNFSALRFYIEEAGGTSADPRGRWVPLNLLGEADFRHEYEYRGSEERGGGLIMLDIAYTASGALFPVWIQTDWIVLTGPES